MEQLLRYLSHDPDREWLYKEFVLGMLGKTKSIQLKKYRQFVEWEKANSFKGRIQKDVPESKMLAPDRSTIINSVCGFYKVHEKGISAMRRGVKNEPRDGVIYLLRTICGEPLMRIGQELGMTQYSSVSSAVEQIKKKRQNDNLFQKRLEEVVESINKGQT